MASAAKVIEPAEEIPLERIALDDAGGDPPKAVEILTDRILAQPEIVQSHLREWAQAWAHAKVHGLIAAQRQRILRAVGSGENFSNALASAMSNEFARLMDMPLFGGKRLGDATVDEVRESAARCGSLANDYGRKAKWQKLVADEAEAKGEGPIGEVLTEETLSRLWSEADV